CVMSGLCNSDISSVAFSMGPSGEGRFIAQYVRLSWFTGNSRARRELACAWPAGMLKGDPRGGTPTYLADIEPRKESGDGSPGYAICARWPNSLYTVI